MFKPLEPKQLDLNVFSLFDDQWLLLTAGSLEKDDFNTMTISWGSMGIMWNKPFVQVVVRPTRYTYQFMNRYEYFTLCAFDESYRAALTLLGTRSGRDGNKIKDSGLTPISFLDEKSVAFKEAQLILGCKKIYWSDLEPQNFLSPDIHLNYAAHDYHRVYYGEIVQIVHRPLD